MKFIPPDITLEAFTCPHCHTYARHIRWGYSALGPKLLPDFLAPAAHIKIARCEACNESCIWLGEVRIYPDLSGGPPANPDIPENVKRLYDEASLIMARSPRSAAALLRLAVQVLLKDLDQPGENINSDIAALVKAGLPERIQQALDVLRVVGNNAVHPGQIDTDDPQVVGQLFVMLNLIVEYQISMPARVAAAYEALPEGAKAQIEKRDGK